MNNSQSTTSSPRKNYDYASKEANAVPAYVPNAVQTIPSELWAKDLTKSQKADFKKYQKKSVKDLIINVKVRTDEEMIKKLASDIENHVEARIHIFFQQLLLVHESGRVYKAHDTGAQIGSGKYRSYMDKEELNENDNLEERSCYAAAHSSTLPSLKYVDEQNREIAFGKGSFFSLYSGGSTILFPRSVNKIDSELDGKNNSKDNKLRQKALETLNQVASKVNRLSPKQGLIDFVDNLVLGADQQAKSCSEKTLQIVQIYQKVAKVYQSNLKDDKKADELIKKLCFVIKDQKDVEVNRKLFLAVQKQMLVLQNLDIDSKSIKDKDQIIVPKIRKSTRIKQQSLSTKKLIDLGTTSLKYKKYCVKAQVIKKLAASYFKKKDEKIKTQISSEVVTLVKTKYKVKPSKLSLITEHILKELKPSTQ